MPQQRVQSEMSQRSEWVSQSENNLEHTAVRPRAHYGAKMVDEIWPISHFTVGLYF